jgi:hypothetical protein
MQALQSIVQHKRTDHDQLRDAVASFLPTFSCNQVNEMHITWSGDLFTIRTNDHWNVLYTKPNVLKLQVAVDPWGHHLGPRFSKDTKLYFQYGAKSIHLCNRLLLDMVVERLAALYVPGLSARNLHALRIFLEAAVQLVP